MWHNDHACGLLYGEFDTVEEAEEAGRDWKTDMVSIDPDPEGAEEEYDWEVVDAEDED